MKVIHFCLSNYFNDGLLYQENQLVTQHVRLGHEVLVVASTEVYDDRGHVQYTQPDDYTGVEGARVIRLPYRGGIPLSLARKVRSYPGIRKILDDFAPDVIMFHGSSAWELRTVARYARAHPKVTFHIDSHSDAINSGQNWVSRELLHRRFYAPILRRAMVRSGPLLCVSLTVMDFAHEVYCIPRERLEFYPLGGQILSEEVRGAHRKTVRQQLGIGEDQIIIVQSGRQDRLKKLPESLRALAEVENPDLRLVIAGVLQDDVREECEARIAADPRVTFLGWQGPDDLTALLCAADVYLQPGRQSATMQHSLCCGCAVILDALPAHEQYINGNGWLISSDYDLRQAIQDIAEADIGDMKAASVSLARRMLDYSVLAERILEDQAQ